MAAANVSPPSRVCCPLCCACCWLGSVLVDIMGAYQGYHLAYWGWLSATPPVHFLPVQARKMIIDRGSKMGMDFAAEIKALYEVDWPSELKQASQREGGRAVPLTSLLLAPRAQALNTSGTTPAGHTEHSFTKPVQNAMLLFGVVFYRWTTGGGPLPGAARLLPPALPRLQGRQPVLGGGGGDDGGGGQRAQRGVRPQRQAPRPQVSWHGTTVEGPVLLLCYTVSGYPLGYPRRHSLPMTASAVRRQVK